jgi:sugar (pentulose or hexulose) kinase
MYNDGRAEVEARELSELEGAPAISASFSLAKISWLARHEPAAFAATDCFAHQADFLLARLSGARGVSDWSNALKSGFDAAAQSWGAWLDRLPELRARLPRVVAPGTPVAPLLPALAVELGLSSEVRVVAGCTDGTAGFLASGASQVGEDNTTLGTTLVFKRVASRRVEDPSGALYCHALPGGLWLPGAASNVGADWIRQEFAGADLSELDRAAEALLPSRALAYPSRARGERFPFQSSSSEGFGPEPSGSVERFAANLQGTAFVERLAYEVLDRATGLPARGAVFCTGGASRSDVWTQLRADVVGRSLQRPACSESALGVALLAAVGCGLFPDLSSAGRQMVRIESTFHPNPARQRALEPLYQRFCAELERRGYLERT